MISYLSTYHDVRAIGIIRAFVAETGIFFGASEAEVKQLELAAEEAALFIINALLPDADESFKISCQLIPQGLSFHFENKGLPVDEENLPVYDSKNPGNSLDGLPFFLIESMTDAVRFLNRGNDGWVLVFEKGLKAFKFLENVEEVAPEVLSQCCKEKLELSIATAEDAYDLVKLTYFTYRYSYAKEVFYYRKALEKAIRTGKIIAFIGKNTQGEVVINSAFFRSPHCDVIVEAGMLMSRPEYRGNRALLRLTRMQLQYITEASNGLRVMYSNLVTAHTRSQRLLVAYNFIPTALKLSVHDQAKFVGMDTHEVGRESLLYALAAPAGFEPTILYVPEPHHDITARLLSPTEVMTISIKSAEADTAETLLSVEEIEEDRYAIVTVEQLGKEWLKVLRKQLQKLNSDGIITVHLHLPADEPLPENIDSDLFQQGLFYSGIILKTMERWELVYTLLQGQHFDFSAVALHEEGAQALKDYMYQQYLLIKEKA